MSTTFTLDTATSRAHPLPEPVRRLTVPAIANRKGKEPVVMLTAYTARMAQLLDKLVTPISFVPLGLAIWLWHWNVLRGEANAFGESHEV